MYRRWKHATAIAALVAALGLAACAGGSDEARSGTDASSTADTPVATEAPPTTTEAIDELERTQNVNAFVGAVELNADCTSFECKTAQATYSRYQNLYELAGRIPGDDILPFLVVISSAWDDWNDCLATAETRFERFDCAEESDMEQAIADLYNALP